MTAMTRHKIATARSPTHTPAHTPPAIQHSSTATTMADEDLREVFLAFCAFGDRANGGRMDGAKVSARGGPRPGILSPVDALFASAVREVLP